MKDNGKDSGKDKVNYPTFNSELKDGAPNRLFTGHCSLGWDQGARLSGGWQRRRRSMFSTTAFAISS